MSFLKTIPEDQAESLLLEQYQAAEKSMGYVPNYIKAFSLHPEVYDAWTKLIGAVRSRMRLRRYELVTFAAAQALDCTYCMLAHGAVLRKSLFNLEQFLAIVKDFRNAGLSAEEVAMMAFAQKISARAQDVSEQDISELRAFGLTDEEILDIILACTARNFFSKTLEAVGAIPDETYKELEPELLHALTASHPLTW